MSYWINISWTTDILVAIKLPVCELPAHASWKRSLTEFCTFLGSRCLPIQRRSTWFVTWTRFDQFHAAIIETTLLSIFWERNHRVAHGHQLCTAPGQSVKICQNANLFGTESASRVRTEIQLLCMTYDCHEVKAKHGYTAECRVR